jgi:hypothetical protein
LAYLQRDSGCLCVVPSRARVSGDSGPVARCAQPLPWAEAPTCNELLPRQPSPFTPSSLHIPYSKGGPGGNQPKSRVCHSWPAPHPSVGGELGEDSTTYTHMAAVLSHRQHVAMRIDRHGALYVVEQAHPKDRVQRELRKLDDRLFLERQVTLENEEVWCVCVDIGLDSPPLTILEWRDERGRPIPDLTDRIVSRVGAMERDHQRLVARVVEANARMVEAARRQADSDYEETVKETAKFMHPMHAGLLPRRGIGEKAKARRLAAKRRQEAWEERLGI